MCMDEKKVKITYAKYDKYGIAVYYVIICDIK